MVCFILVQIHCIHPKVAEGVKAAEKVGRDRDAQRGTLAALSRDIDAVKQRETALGSKARKRDGGLSRLSEDKAAVRLGGVGLFFSLG